MICVSIIGKDNGEVLKKAARAEALADMLEIRLDLMDRFYLPHIIGQVKKPVIATYRSVKEMGKGSADYATTIRYLKDAVHAGADYVDVEYQMPPGFRDQLTQNRRQSKIIISCHLPGGTPPLHTLEAYLENMADAGADIVKIVPLATKKEDNLQVMQLILKAKEMGVEIIAFCMGPLGLISRIASPILGGYLTFASLDEGEEAGAGQLPALKMKEIWETLNRCA